jgi:hypothetical protein
MTRVLIVSRDARYAALAVFAAGLLLGASRSNSGDSAQKIVGWALQLPAGNGRKGCHLRHGRDIRSHVLLAVVALGFIALGLHSWANARWVRMPAG